MLLYYSVTALHVIVCLILILVVLLQSGKGADLAGAFGGGATQTAFGSRGPASFLSKLTTVAAVLFMVTCLSLSLMGEKQESKSILETTKGKAAPAQKAPAPAQPVPAAPTPDQIKKMQEEAEAKAKQPAGAQSAPAPSPADTKTPEKAPEAKKQ
jgi:preprotein translocase subunit SecG